MAKVTIKDVPPLDGEYKLDMAQQFNGHEVHLIKDLAGVRLFEIEEALGAGDYDLFVALAVIALWRAGKASKTTVRAVADALLNVAGGITLDFTEDEKQEDGGERPPDLQTASGTLSEPAAENEPPEKTGGSGESSRNDGDPSELGLRAIGSHG